ncbi:MAG TPA: hypothetical protein VKV40_16475 [Ktedonobacteraceae bacterium]|nr:hypothetical protein [Ktedonobacteraceae bacterium]
MPGSDQTDAIRQQALPEAAQGEQTEVSPLAPEKEREDQGRFSAQVSRETRNRFDWIAVGCVALVAAFFAVVSRFNIQPPNSLTPIAVLSATGCGLLITALRKLRTPKGPGLAEAALGGFVLALFPFLAAITAPDVLSALSTNSDEMHGFMTAWALILVFSMLFSVIGATLGHLAFAPLRPLPARPQEVDVAPLPETEEDKTGATDEESAEDEETANEKTAPTSEGPRSLLSYLVAVLLLGLLPTIAGYVFSAAFDFMLKVYGFFPGPYPTLRLLSGLLPWQIPVSIGFNGAGGQSGIYLEWQYWRIPLFLGNPTMFDLVALEPYILNGAALALLLFAAYRFMSNSQREISASPTAWSNYLLFEALLGLLIVFPAALWIMRGLEGLLQMPGIVLPIRTLYLLNPLTFTLDIITGPLACLLIAILLRLLLMRNRHPV